MRSLLTAIYGEGATEARFLPVLVQRAIQQLVFERGIGTVEVLDPVVVSANASSQDERILHAAQAAMGYDLLIIHADGDAPDASRALEERYQPGLELVEQQPAHSVCRHLVPLIPIRMTEAWMLADGTALRAVIGTNANDDELGIPSSPTRVEALADPKATLRIAAEVAVAHRRRARRRIDIGAVHEPLARQIDMARLSLVPSFQQFMHDLTNTLIEIRVCD